jgi:hypothetical protein
MHCGNVPQSCAIRSMPEAPYLHRRPGPALVPQPYSGPNLYSQARSKRQQQQSVAPGAHAPRGQARGGRVRAVQGLSAAIGARAAAYPCSAPLPARKYWSGSCALSFRNAARAFRSHSTPALPCGSTDRLNSSSVAQPIGRFQSCAAQFQLRIADRQISAVSPSHAQSPSCARAGGSAGSTEESEERCTSSLPSESWTASRTLSVCSMPRRSRSSVGGPSSSQIKTKYGYSRPFPRSPAWAQPARHGAVPGPVPCRIPCCGSLCRLVRRAVAVRGMRTMSLPERAARRRICAVCRTSVRVRS